MPALGRRRAAAATEWLRAALSDLDWVNTSAAALAVALLVAFSRSPYLPMVDLAQHAAQLSMWIHHSDPAFPEARFFEINWRTPYLTAYALARAVAVLTGVVHAMKLVTWTSVVLHFLAFRWLVKLLGYARWTALLGFVTGLGYPFFFGFVSFLVAMPLVLASVCLALEHRRAPALHRGLWLALASSATLASHGFAFGLSMLFVAPLLHRGAGSFSRRAAPLAAPFLLWLVWIAPGSAVRSIGATIWAPRLTELLGLPALFFASSATDHVALAFGYGALVLVASSFARPSREPERFVPLALLVLGFCTFPVMMSGFGPLHPRFAALFLPALLLAFEPRKRVPRATTVLAGAFTAAWFGCFAYRLALWNAEARPLARVIDALPPHLRVRPVVFERTSTAFPGLPAHLHLPAYYQAEKGGTQGYSFAMYPTSAVRYVPGFPFGMGSGQEWHPEAFSYENERGAYDVFLVHSTDDLSEWLFRDRARELELDAAEGNWRAYRVASAHTTTTE